MLLITVDEGYAYDYHSIAFCKVAKTSDAKSVTNLKRIDLDLAQQLGEKLHQNILSSPEYKNLVATNEKLYDLVDLAKKDAVPASEVDRWVYKRWLAKKALQTRFFPEKPYQEQKFGYEQKT